MTKDLTNSSVHRQNILNNPYALQEIEKATRISGISAAGDWPAADHRCGGRSGAK